MDRTGPSQTRIRGFDGLRALALVFVFLQHYTTLGRVYSTGGYGVWLFFVLSGFLIVRILAGERVRVEAGTTTAPSALARFYWRRTLRIFPPYYLALAVFTVLGALHLVRDFPLSVAPWHYAYLSNIYFGEVAGRWVGRFGHFWSLAIEEQFYLVAAPLLMLAPARWARPLCGAVVLAALTCDVSMRTAGASDMALYTNSLINFGALAFGGWLGLSLPARARPGTASWPALAGLALIVVFIWGFTQTGAMQASEARLVSAAPFWTGTLLAGLAVAGVYLNPESRLVRVLEWAPVAGFGRISYGFYLYHNLLPHWMLTRAAQQAGLAWRPGEWIEALFALALGLVLALLSWRFVEQPLLRLKDRPPRFVRAAPAAGAA